MDRSAAVLILLAAGVVAAPPVAVTSSGTLAGVSVQTAAGAVNVFLGVRYAAPPLGAARFAPPAPHEADRTRPVDASRYGAACHQPPHLTELMYPQLTKREKERVVSEDCLFLNVFSPASSAAPRALMVWLPGEGFSFADAAQFDGSSLAARGDVVVVTVNYRVGVFGFLSTGNSSAPGNLGLRDALEALRWVRLNAAALGGDPARVTLFGRFTGAMLASLALTSPCLVQRPPGGGVPRPLAARVVLQSGVATAGYVLDPDPCNRTATLARLAACSGTHDQVMQCLRSLPADRLDELSWRVPELWRPHVDGALVPADPLHAVRRGSYDRGVQVMVGETSGEGSLCLLQHYFLETVYTRSMLADNLTRREFGQLVREHVYDYLKVRDPSVWEAAAHEYRPWPPGDASYRDNFLRLCGALYSRVRAEQLARWLARAGTPVWRYEFAHRPRDSPHPGFMGAAHGDEVLFVFGLLDEAASDPRELGLQDRVVAAWTNFAKNGDPNPVGDGPTWPQFVDASRQVYVLSAAGDSNRSSEFLSRDVDFWGAVVPRLVRHTHRAVSHGRKQHGPAAPAGCGGPSTSVPLVLLSLVLATTVLLISYYLIHHSRTSAAGALLADELTLH